MKHQNGRRKLNLKPAHRKALLRNQLIHFIKFGFLQTTKVRAKEVQRFAEKVVTIARTGYDFNTIRRVKQILPYDEAAAVKMIKEIAPKYVGRPGGYTRLISLGQREGDTAKVARLEWV